MNLKIAIIIFLITTFLSTFAHGGIHMNPDNEIKNKFQTTEEMVDYYNEHIFIQISGNNRLYEMVRYKGKTFNFIPRFDGDVRDYEFAIYTHHDNTILFENDFLYDDEGNHWRLVVINGEVKLTRKTKTENYRSVYINSYTVRPYDDILFMKSANELRND